jgi:hypothetical protein
MIKLKTLTIINKNKYRINIQKFYNGKHNIQWITCY